MHFWNWLHLSLHKQMYILRWICIWIWMHEKSSTSFLHPVWNWICCLKHHFLASKSNLAHILRCCNRAGHNNKRLLDQHVCNDGFSQRGMFLGCLFASVFVLCVWVLQLSERCRDELKKLEWSVGRVWPASHLYVCFVHKKAKLWGNTLRGKQLHQVKAIPKCLKPSAIICVGRHQNTQGCSVNL